MTKAPFLLVLSQLTVLERLLKWHIAGVLPVPNSSLFVIGLLPLLEVLDMNVLSRVMLTVSSMVTSVPFLLIFTKYKED